MEDEPSSKGSDQPAPFSAHPRTGKPQPFRHISRKTSIQARFPAWYQRCIVKLEPGKPRRMMMPHVTGHATMIPNLLSSDYFATGDIPSNHLSANQQRMEGGKMNV